jgi:hypothetical protein
MKLEHLVRVSTLCAGLCLTVGCRQQDEAGPAGPGLLLSNTSTRRPVVAAPPRPPSNGAVPVVITQAVPPAPLQTNAARTNAATNPANPPDKTQALVDTVLKLAAEKKWLELAPKVVELQTLKLTPEQEDSLVPLYEELEKRVKEAGAGSLLPKK